MAIVGVTVGKLGVGLNGNSGGGIAVSVGKLSVGGADVFVAVGGSGVLEGAGRVAVSVAATGMEFVSSDGSPWPHAVSRQARTMTVNIFNIGFTLICLTNES